MCSQQTTGSGGAFEPPLSVQPIGGSWARTLPGRIPGGHPDRRPVGLPLRRAATWDHVGRLGGPAPTLGPPSARLVPWAALRLRSGRHRLGGSWARTLPGRVPGGRPGPLPSRWPGTAAGPFARCAAWAPFGRPFSGTRGGKAVAPCGALCSRLLRRRAAPGPGRPSPGSLLPPPPSGPPGPRSTSYVGSRGPFRRRSAGWSGSPSALCGWPWRAALVRCVRPGPPRRPGGSPLRSPRVSPRPGLALLRFAGSGRRGGLVPGVLRFACPGLLPPGGRLPAAGSRLAPAWPSSGPGSARPFVGPPGRARSPPPVAVRPAPRAWGRSLALPPWCSLPLALARSLRFRAT